MTTDREPFSFDDLQIERVIDAASILPQALRSDFLKLVVAYVGPRPMVTTSDLEIAIAAALHAYGLSAPSQKKGTPKGVPSQIRALFGSR